MLGLVLGLVGGGALVGVGLTNLAEQHVKDTNRQYEIIKEQMREQLQRLNPPRQRELPR